MFRSDANYRKLCGMLQGVAYRHRLIADITTMFYLFMVKQTASRIV